MQARGKRFCDKHDSEKSTDKQEYSTTHKRKKNSSNLDKKIKVSQNDSITVQSLLDVGRDGNCFYRCISAAYFGSEEQWKTIKDRAIEYLIENKEFLVSEFPKEFLEELIDFHSEENQWADDLMIFTTAHSISTKIIIESQEYKENISFLEDEKERVIKLKHINGNHFMLYTNKYKYNDTNPRKITSSELSKFKVKMSENDEFVDSTSGSGTKDYYKQVFMFLSKNIIPEKYNETKVGLKDWKKRAREYKILDFPLSILTDSTLVHRESITELYVIPLKKDLERIFHAAHIYKDIHLAYYRAMERLKVLKIKYPGYSNDLHKYISSCAFCFQQVPPKPKPQSYNPIKTTKPKELVQFDCVYLDKKFGMNKYLLNAIDHFSKYAWAFLIEKINSKNTRDCLAIVHQECNFQIDSVHTDNGSEFKKYFEQYLTENQITRKLGAAYKPTTQGAIERFNRTIQDQLEKLFRAKANGPDFDLQKELDKVLKIYNNEWIHSTTGMIPAELLNENDLEILENVIIKRDQIMSNACEAKTVSLYARENQHVLIRDDIIHEKRSNVWYLENKKKKNVQEQATPPLVQYYL